MAALAALPAMQTAQAEGGFIDFTPDVYAAALESGDPFLLGILSDW
jgi:hypothetical protein